MGGENEEGGDKNSGVGEELDTKTHGAAIVSKMLGSFINVSILYINLNG